VFAPAASDAGQGPSTAAATVVLSSTFTLKIPPPRNSASPTRAGASPMRRTTIRRFPSPVTRSDPNCR
jgi:hypothetical protein